MTTLSNHIYGLERLMPPPRQGNLQDLRQTNMQSFDSSDIHCIQAEAFFVLIDLVIKDNKNSGKGLILARKFKLQTKLI